MTYFFTLDGKVRGKGRPRFRRRGNYVQTYTDEATRDYEAAIRKAFAQQNLPQAPLDGALDVRIMACYGKTKGMSKAFWERCENGEEHPTKKPDADNIAKAVLDALNGIAFKDDNQVVALSVFKKYYYEDKLVVSIIELQKRRWWMRFKLRLRSTINKEL